MKNRIFLQCALITMVLLAGSCKKSSTPAVTTVSNFYHGYIGTVSSPGPGNAILLRSDGSMREYANDYYSAGTTMTANDTASASIKIDGNYIATTGSETTVTATWYQPNGSPALTYTLTGTVTGSMMTGTIKDEGTGISTVANFSFTTP